jgi:predicted Zn-dependent protease
VPVSAEEKLGQLVVSQMGGVPEKELLAKDPATYHALDAIVQTMAKAHPSPYTFRVTVAETEDVNAFAAPGGYVVVNRGLLKRTRRPEELAGVLAHEMQHVYQRHATRNLFRQLGIQAILTALTGDAGTLGTAVGMAGQFGGLSYQRRDEAEADAEGMKLVLAAKLDPKGMIAAYEMLDRDAPDVPEGLGFLSTHPGTKERIASLRGLAADARYEPMPLLPDLPWKQIVGAGGH